MEEFKNLLSIADRLLAPGGCPWDREQTLFSLQPYLLEEIHELIEAIDIQDSEHIAEELGDVLYALIFVGKLGEKNKMFTLCDAIKLVNEKLIRRHPHVFGKTKVESTEDIVKNWEAIKKTEQAGKERKSILDGIPASLPLLPRVQKVIKKLKRAKSSLIPVVEKKASEDEIAKELWKLIAVAEYSEVDIESALRRYCISREEKLKKTPEIDSRQELNP